ncbi:MULTISPECIES: 5,6-dimethylbenzimidazole synthase [unclassified Luteococcus]|uniref:5,6-dimethylbenzimidazole synthase n=1 Tax=unclassified Luteococcus TaxID=2639923 RepID=UPI00313C73CA
MAERTSFPRPVPLVGDTSAAHERATDPRGWAFDQQTIDALDRVLTARRDIRRFRPDPVPEELVRTLVAAGHAGPSVGHSQPWRFIVVEDAELRDRAAAMADKSRLWQAAQLAPERGQQLLDLKLEGLREAPLGLVVACDRRTPAVGVLGRATFTDADMWSCAAAIENIWLTARAHGLGMGWVTLFQPEELAALLGLPEGVETLGWLCLGWPDERPPSPGLERLAWSKKLPVDDVLLRDRWPGEEPPAPTSHLRAPDQQRMVGATDDADDLLTTPGSLGVLDRALNRAEAVRPQGIDGGCLVLVGADHPVTEHRISSFEPRVTRDVLGANVEGTGMGVVSATGAGLRSLVVDAGVETPVGGARPARPQGPRGNLTDADALGLSDATRLVEAGRALGVEAARDGLVVLGEVGIGNTTVAAALAAALLDLQPDEAVGLGTAADADMLARKRQVVARALARWRGQPGHDDPLRLVAALGGGEFAVLAGVVLGATQQQAVVLLDGLATSVAALLAVRLEPGAQAYLVAGQQSRERAHAAVLTELGLEPLLALRLRSGEGVGGCLAASLLLQGQQIRRLVARTR